MPIDRKMQIFEMILINQKNIEDIQ
jgi:hypothetical protein